MNEQLDPLTFVATSDLCAVTKGRSMPTADFDESETVGWVPANLGIGAGGHIAEMIPFGSVGDLRLRPDRSSSHRIQGVPGRPDVDVVFGDLVDLDGSPWGCCPRSFLRQVVEDLRSEFGVNVVAAFEHEFMDLDAAGEHHPFSWSNFRQAEPHGSRLVSAMQRSGLEPENWLPEYGEHQYEITVKRASALESADRAILVRDIVRDVFSAGGHRATFNPMARPGGAGNGVHVHFGLVGEDGANLVFDENGDCRLSELGGRFAAGILEHARAITALFAPLTVSYLRLRPHQWASAGVFLGLHDREALLRLCPTVEIDGRDPAPQLHFEFRGGDIGANPWLLLGSVLRAGLEGLRRNATPAPVVVGATEKSIMGLPQLPRDLGEALDLFEADETVRGWFHPDLVSTFLRLKREEIRELTPMSDAEQCEWYSLVY